MLFRSVIETLVGTPHIDEAKTKFTMGYVSNLSIIFDVS